MTSRHISLIATIVLAGSIGACATTTPTELDRQKIAEAAKAGVTVRDSQVKTSQAALASTRAELNKERRDNTVASTELRAANTAQSKELQATTAQLEAEKLS